jgi:hypothetical protein
VVTGAVPADGGQQAVPATGGGQQAAAPKLPPVTALATTTMVLVISGGIYVAAYLPRHAPLALPVGLLAAAAGVLAANVVLLSRVRPFAWHAFFQVGGWTLLAYAIIAGMLEFVFLLDHTSGSLLALLTLTLVIFAVDVPLLLAFSVARYQPAQ